MCSSFRVRARVGQGKNVMSVDYAKAHFGCQLGILASRMSKSGKIGGSPRARRVARGGRDHGQLPHLRQAGPA